MTINVLRNESFGNLRIKSKHLLFPVAAVGLACALGLSNDVEVENRPKQISHVIVVRECTPYESNGVYFVNGKIEYDLSKEGPAERLVIE